MIFSGMGQKEILAAALSESCECKGWQLNNGDFSGLYINEKALTDFLSEKSVLDGINLNNCCMEKAWFEKSQLREGLINKSYLKECLFSSCSARRFSFWGSTLDRCRFRGCFLPRLKLNACVMRGGSFSECEISRGMIERSVFFKVSFSAEHVSGLTGFPGTVFESCLFINCSFSYSSIQMTQMDNCCFMGCKFFGNRDLNCRMNKKGGSWEDFKKEFLCIQN